MSAAWWCTTTKDNEWGQYGSLANYLAGPGVPDIQEAMKEIFLQPIHYPFRELVNPGFFQWALDNRVERLSDLQDEDLRLEQVLEEAYIKSLTLLSAARDLISGSGSPEPAAREQRHRLEAVLTLPALAECYPAPRSRKYSAALKYLAGKKEQENLNWGGRLAWVFTHNLGKMQDEEEGGEISRSWMDEWLLGKSAAQTLVDLGSAEERAWQTVQILKLMIGHQDWCGRFLKSKEAPFQTLQSWLRDGEVQRFLGVNRHQGVLWYNKEAMEELLWWMFNAAVIQITADFKAVVGEAEAPGSGEAAHPAAGQITACYEIIRRIQEADAAAGYRVEKLLEGARNQA
jgi:hypothetical protein